MVETFTKIILRSTFVHRRIGCQSPENDNGAMKHDSPSLPGIEEEIRRIFMTIKNIGVSASCF
jgi:hypothetical protein